MNQKQKQPNIFYNEVINKKKLQSLMSLTFHNYGIIKSSIIAKGGEVFVLDMGDPIRIIDLATKMILLSGKTIKNKDHKNGDIEIKIVGLQPGEKLYEELLIGNNPIKTQESKILMAQENYLSWKELRKNLKLIEKYLHLRDIKSINNIFIQMNILMALKKNNI